MYLTVIVVCLFVSKSAFSKSYFKNTIRVANSLYPDQARRSVGPYLGPNRLQKLSASDSSRQIVKQQISFNFDVDSMGVPVVNSVEPVVLSGSTLFATNAFKMRLQTTKAAKMTNLKLLNVYFSEALITN